MGKDNYIRRIKDIEVLDGDTIRGVVELGFGMEWRMKGRKNKPTFRFLGVNAPETSRRGRWDNKLSGDEVLETLERGQAAKRFVQDQIRKASLVSIGSPDWAEDSFGRILANVYLVFPDGESKTLNKMLLDEGHAEVYEK